MTAALKPERLGRTPRRAVVIEETMPGLWVVVMWQLNGRDTVISAPNGRDVAERLAIDVHRANGLPLGIRHLGCAARSFQRGVHW